MTFSLRHLSRSRTLRVLAVMAWLMLVTTSLIAAPMPAASVGGESSHAALVSHHHYRHGDHAGSHAAAAASGCCQGHMGAACHCASLCGIALVPAPGHFALSWIVPSTGRAYGAARAPTRILLPPLRPPLV